MPRAVQAQWEAARANRLYGGRECVGYWAGGSECALAIEKLNAIRV